VFPGHGHPVENFQLFHGSLMLCNFLLQMLILFPKVFLQFPDAKMSRNPCCHIIPMKRFGDEIHGAKLNLLTFSEVSVTAVIKMITEASLSPSFSFRRRQTKGLQLFHQKNA